MRWICFWCAVLMAAAARAQEGYYAPQTFRQHIETPYQNTLFAPASRNDAASQGSISEHWRPAPAPVYDSWREPEQFSPVLPRHEPWRPPQSTTNEQKATILHHKQSLSSEGSFRFEYASDNGQAAGEVIEPDGSRVGAYQYKDPNGQLVKLKYRAGKEGFQILEGSHLPKSPEPVAPTVPEHPYQQAYEQQAQQYQPQQQHDQQRPAQQFWTQDQGRANQGGAGGQFFVQNSNWRSQTQGSGREDDGQYRENDVEQPTPGPHSFGAGYAFSFEG